MTTTLVHDQILEELQKVTTRITELESFVRKFLDNFDDCELCAGKGAYTDEYIECRRCHGTGKDIVSLGVLYVELPEHARQLLKKGGSK